MVLLYEQPNVGTLFYSYGWRVIQTIDGNKMTCRMELVEKEIGIVNNEVCQHYESRYSNLKRFTF